MREILKEEFFHRDVLEVAPDLLGKYLVRRFEDGRVERFRITDIEAYRGEEDKACHASKGRTKRSETLYAQGGIVYIYLIYGMYWLLNFVTGRKDHPQAVLIRGVEGIDGPGRVSRRLELDGSILGKPTDSDELWLEDEGVRPEYTTGPRIGIDYAAEWRNKPWRFMVKE